MATERRAGASASRVQCSRPAAGGPPWSLPAPGAFGADGEGGSCTRAIAVRWKLEPDALLAPVCPAGLVPLPLRRRLLPPRLRVRAASAPAGPSSAPSSASRPCVCAVECMLVTAALEQFDAAVERLAASPAAAGGGGGLVVGGGGVVGVVGRWWRLQKPPNPGNRPN